MQTEWAEIAVNDVTWIGVAFALGLLARMIKLPPLVGFLAAGFLLNAAGLGGGGEMLAKLSDLGITLLLFIVGLKLNLGTLARPQVWAVTGIHMAIVVVAVGFGIYGLALLGVAPLSDLDMSQALLIAFALSFSSTVFVVKALEERGEFASLHGRVAIGILIMQDIVAVGFLAISTGEAPSVWALSLLLLVPMRALLHKLLVKVGHGELLVLYGFLLALGGAELFELVQLKGDLGALLMGILMSTHFKADELSKKMLSFKELFLLGFFLSIGLSGNATPQAVMLGLALVPILVFKSVLFFALLTRFKLRSRTALLASLNLMNYSEFGLIVAAIGVKSGIIDNSWLVAIAISVAASFVVAAIATQIGRRSYTKHLETWTAFQRQDLTADDRAYDTFGARIAIIGMGEIGRGAYDKMRDIHGEMIIGIDTDPVVVNAHTDNGRRVLCGDPADADLWDRFSALGKLDMVMLTLPNIATNIAVITRLREAGYRGPISAVSRYPDETPRLEAAGVTSVFNAFAETGTGFAIHVASQEAIGA